MLFLGALAAGGLGIHCSGAGAVGVEDCRRLESLRCDVSQHCGTITDVGACQRFYRDQCLRGFPLAASPAATDVESCAIALQGAGDCARDLGSDSPLTGCPNAELARGHDARITTVCEAIGAPERLTACAFLISPPNDAGIPSGPGTGGASAELGSGGSGSGDTAGSGGAPTD